MPPWPASPRPCCTQRSVSATLWRRPEGFIAFAFVAMAAALSAPAVWVEAYAFARAFTPLLLVVGLDALRARSWLGLLPLALTAPRVGLQYAVPAVHILRRLLGFHP